jgi:hypothetical protein
MGKWAVRLAVVLLLAALLLGGVVLWEPTGVVRGWWRGESFFQGRPTDYWRRTLEGSDPAEEERALRRLEGGGAAAVPVLAEMVRDRRPSESVCPPSKRSRA